jgi:O-antigen/teichoic acid export membrane protein
MSQPKVTGRPVQPRGGGAGAPAPANADLAAVGRGSLLGLAGAGFSAVANLALALVVTRGFGRHDAGLFFSATAIFLVLEMLSRMGTDYASIYFIARLRALGDSHLIVAHLRAIVKPVAAVVLTCAAALAIFAGPLSRSLLGGSALLDLQVLAAILPFTVAYDICLAATRGFGTVKAATLLEKLIRPGLQLVLLLIVAAMGKANLLALAWALPYLVVLPPAVVVLRRLIRKENVKQEHRPGGDIAKTFWKFAAPRSISGLAQALLQRLDIVIVAAILGPADAAVYAAATRFLVLGQLGNQAISAPVEPRLSGLLARRDIAGAQDVYRMSTAWLICVNWPMFLVTAVYASTIMEAFGKGYHSGWSVATLLCLCMVVAVGVGLVDVVLVFGGRATWNLYNTVAALAINITVDVLLLPHIGVIGAAVGWGVAILATNIVPLLQIHRLLGLHPFGKRVFTAAAITSVSFALIPGVTRLLLGGGVVSLVVAAFLGLAVYVVLLRQFRDVLQLDLLLGRLMRLGGGGRRQPQARAAVTPAAPVAAPAPAVLTAAAPSTESVDPADVKVRRHIGRHRWSG